MLSIEEAVAYISTLDQSQWKDKTQDILIDELINKECYLDAIDGRVQRVFTGDLERVLVYLEHASRIL